MKNLFIAIAFTIGVLHARAQQHIIFYDALTLKADMSANGGKFTIKDNETLLKCYFGEYLSNNELAAAIEANPFLKAYFNPPPVDITEREKPHAVRSAAPGSGGAGGGFVTQVADGVAQFLIQRAEDELDEAFFTKLKKFLADYPEFATLFPNTNTFLGSTNTWEYNNLLNTLREALDKDIKLLPADLAKLKDLDTAACNAAGNPQSKQCLACKIRINELKNALQSKSGLLLVSACQVANGVIQNQKIPDIISNLGQSGILLSRQFYQPVFSLDVVETVDLAADINQTIKSNETGKSYITPAQFDTLTAPGNATNRNLFLGLLYQQIRGLQINGKSVTTNLTPQNYSGIINYISNIYTQAKNLQTAADNLRTDKLNAKADLSADYAALIETTQQTFEAAYTLNIINPDFTLPDDLKTLQDYSDQALQIANDIFIKNYNASVMSTVNLIKEAIGGDDNTAPDKFLSDFLKYESFAANIAEAKSAADVKAAIDAAALPAGSYTVKQKSDWNITFNGYAGYGFDFNSATHLSRGLFANGVYAPVGFAITHGSTKQYGVPVTLFVGVIDVGSLVSYRLNNGATDSLKQDLRLQSIISPSAQLFFEIPTTPISAGFGWRLTPQLFYSGNSNFTAVPSRSVFNVSVLIDIPIFTISNTPFENEK